MKGTRYLQLRARPVLTLVVGGVYRIWCGSAFAFFSHGEDRRPTEEEFEEEVDESDIFGAGVE